MDWLDLLAVQGTLKSLLQHHSGSDHPPGTQRLVRVPVLYHESPPAAGAAAAAALPFPLAPAAPAPPPPLLGFSGALAYPLAAFPAAASAPFLRAQMPGLV